MSEELFFALVLFALGAFAFWAVARWTVGLASEWRLQRAMELHMEERVALVTRGLHPNTLASLSPPPDGGE